SSDLWDLYVDQAIFACRIRTHTTTKTSPFFLLYGRQPHLLGDVNMTLPIDADTALDDERLKILESACKEAAFATYERAMKDKDARDDLVKPHALEEGEWVLVRHENPQKFEAKWFGPYQIVEKKLLGTYRLQDPNGHELDALIHGNRLIKANVSTADELRDLWAPPKGKDRLRKRNRNVELIPSYPENTDSLDRYLQDNDDDDEDLVDISELNLEELGQNPKRKRQIFNEITVEQEPPAKRLQTSTARPTTQNLKNTTPSSKKV